MTTATQLRAFHARYAGAAYQVFGEMQPDTYALLAACAGPTDRVLDLGCGDGTLLARLPDPSRCAGLDMSPDELALARSRLPTVALHLGHAQALPFADASFDLVLSHMAFMLMDDIEQVVAELRRVIAPGGRFVAMIGANGPLPAPQRAILRAAWAMADAEGVGGPWGDPRAGDPQAWPALFGPGWEVDPPVAVDATLSLTPEALPAFLERAYYVIGLLSEASRARLFADLPDTPTAMLFHRRLVQVRAPQLAAG